MAGETTFERDVEQRERTLMHELPRSFETMVHNILVGRESGAGVEGAEEVSFAVTNLCGQRFKIESTERIFLDTFDQAAQGCRGKRGRGQSPLAGWMGKGEETCCKRLPEAVCVERA